MVWDVRCEAITSARVGTPYQAPVLAVQVITHPCHTKHPVGLPMQALRLISDTQSWS